MSELEPQLSRHASMPRNIVVIGGGTGNSTVVEGLTERATLLEIRASVEASGGSFDVFKYLQENGATEDDMNDLYAGFIDNSHQDDLVYEDTWPFLMALDEREQQFIILTYGGEAWQDAKIVASGLDMFDCMITDRPDKGNLIASWRQPDGRYRFHTAVTGLVIAETVELIDDKASSFTGLPEDCYGEWLMRPDVKSVPSQAGKVPANVTRVSGLMEILDLTA